MIPNYLEPTNRVKFENDPMPIPTVDPTLTPVFVFPNFRKLTAFKTTLVLTAGGTIATSDIVGADSAMPTSRKLTVSTTADLALVLSTIHGMTAPLRAYVLDNRTGQEVTLSGAAWAYNTSGKNTLTLASAVDQVTSGPVYITGYVFDDSDANKILKVTQNDYTTYVDTFDLYNLGGKALSEFLATGLTAKIVKIGLPEKDDGYHLYEQFSDNKVDYWIDALAAIMNDNDINVIIPFTNNPTAYSLISGHILASNTKEISKYKFSVLADGISKEQTVFSSVYTIGAAKAYKGLLKISKPTTGSTWWAPGSTVRVAGGGATVVSHHVSSAAGSAGAWDEFICVAWVDAADAADQYEIVRPDGILIEDAVGFAFSIVSTAILAGGAVTGPYHMMIVDNSIGGVQSILTSDKIILNGVGSTLSYSDFIGGVKYVNLNQKYIILQTINELYNTNAPVHTHLPTNVTADITYKATRFLTMDGSSTGKLNTAKVVAASQSLVSGYSNQYLCFEIGMKKVSIDDETGNGTRIDVPAYYHAAKLAQDAITSISDKVVGAAPFAGIYPPLDKNYHLSNNKLLDADLNSIAAAGATVLVAKSDDSLVEIRDLISTNTIDENRYDFELSIKQVIVAKAFKQTFDPFIRNKKLTDNFINNILTPAHQGFIDRMKALFVVYDLVLISMGRDPARPSRLLAEYKLVHLRTYKGTDAVFKVSAE